MNKQVKEYVVKSRVKEFVLEGKGRFSGEAWEGLNYAVGELLDQAVKRAKANGRKTVQAHDFVA